MRTDHFDNDDIDILLREALPDDLSPTLKSRMQSILNGFRERFAGRPSGSDEIRGFRAFAQVALCRWKLVFVCVSIGFIALSTTIDNSRQARIDALTVDNLSPQLVQSLQGGADTTAYTREFEQLFAQAPSDQIKRGNRKGDNSL